MKKSGYVLNTTAEDQWIGPLLLEPMCPMPSILGQNTELQVSPDALIAC